MRAVLIGFLTLAGLMVALLGLRGGTHGSRPLEVFSDMDTQPRYPQQGGSPFFADGRAMRLPPAGTVAFGGDDYAADAGAVRQNPDLLQADDAYYRGQRGDVPVARGPAPVTMALLERGRERFGIYCTPCHGAAGRGDGIMTQYKFVGVADLHIERIRLLPDGEIFNVITNGKGLMKPYGEQVPPGDRWAIIAYVRALQRSRHAGLADVPAAERGALRP